MIKVKRGLDLPISGEPDQAIAETKIPAKVAVLGGDYIGMKPTMAVRVADKVRLGQLLFTDKNTPGIRYTSPGSGKVMAIHRGAKRALLSVVIQLAGGGEETFQSYAEGQLGTLKREQVVTQLLESGLWTVFRTRPFSRVPNPETSPHSIFITAMDTNPLAPSINKILEGQERDLGNGLKVISKLTDGKIFVCKAPKTEIPQVDLPNLVVEKFSGPHPAGLVGTHIHFLDPVNRKQINWHIGLQDVIAVGRLFTTGRLHMERVISLAGPSVKKPRLIKTRIGAAVEDITAGELTAGENRMISGSVLSGYRAKGPTAFLGRYHQQISVLPEYRKQELLGYLNPGLNLYSIKNIVFSKLIPNKKFEFNTSTRGEKRAIIPSYNYERVMPLDIMPLFLLRALAVDDVEEAENLGCLEMDEEDLALCAFVCPSKLEFGPLLRRNLTLIEKEG